MRSVMMMVVFTVCAQGWAQTQDVSVEAWRLTDLNLALTKTFINNQSCRSSERYLNSCRLAIAAAANHLTQPFPVNADLDFEKSLADIEAELPPGIPAQKMFGAAITAHLRAFDAHAYLRPTADPAVKKSEFVGVGLVVRKRQEGFLVTEVIDGSPAMKAGLVVGDLITKEPSLDGSGVGSVARLRLLRDGIESSLSLSRIHIAAKNIEAQILPLVPSVGYIRLRQFIAGQSCFAVQDQLVTLRAHGASKFILDLRGNSGGALFEGLCVGGLFVGLKDQVGSKFHPLEIPQANLIHVFDDSSEISWLTGYTLEPFKVPLVVLIDANSASASEVVAGSIQFHEAGWLVGEPTFGKGSVQTVEALTDHPTLTLAATTALYYFPNLLSNQRVGITPSFAVPIEPGHAVDEPGTMREAKAFPNSLAAVNSSWADSRTDAIASIRACIEKDGLGRQSGDYQKAYAVAVLKCMTP